MYKNRYIAANRFGLGLGAQELQISDNDLGQWLWAQVQQPASVADFSGLPTAKDTIVKRMVVNKTGNKDAQEEFLQALRKAFVNGMGVRALHAMTTPAPFYERLVNFWSNHFTVSVKKPSVGGLAIAYECEAIRPYVTGNFTDMVLAVAHHPAMLFYLDNAESIGPGSVVGQHANKGLNENLAREIMELHTLGVNGKYTQVDVTTFAKVLTGWGVANAKQGTPGEFAFFPQGHEPGKKMILGRSYADDGEAQGIAVLRDLAAHPATAQHIATKLARHFVADNPPDTAVQKLAKAFMQSGGDLKTIYRTLIQLPEAWSLDTPKVKSSYDLLVSAARLTGVNGLHEAWPFQSLKFLGNMPFEASSPAGWPDMARDIAGPDALVRRVEWAQGAAGKLPNTQSYQRLADLAIGPILSAATRDALNAARSDREGLGLLLGSPEFQRR